jgi:hypothetical protein
MLADSPDDFKSCAHIVPRPALKGRSPYSMTNRGLAIKLIAIPWSLDTYLVRLDCVDEREAFATEVRVMVRLAISRYHADYHISKLALFLFSSSVRKSDFCIL